MKINVKTLKGTEFFEVNLKETDTVDYLDAHLLWFVLSMKVCLFEMKKRLQS